MTVFSRKSISRIKPLGERLRHERETLNLSLREVAVRTGIQEKYLTALEGGRYGTIPGEVYVRNFLKEYAGFLNLNIERVFVLYERERTVVTHGDPIHPPKELPEQRALNVPQFARRAAVVLGILAILVYLGAKARDIVAAPTLEVSAPSQDFVTEELSVRIEGQAAAESTVTINGQEVFLDGTGRFSERIDLQPGLNVIKIAASKERSKEQVVYRKVIVENQPTDIEGGRS